MAASAMVIDPRKHSVSVLPRVDALLSPAPAADEEDDLYGRLKSLQRQIEFIDIQEEYVKDELKNLKREHLRAQEEVKRIQSVPLVIGQFMEMVDQNNGIVGSTTGSNYYVRILSTINRELLKPSASVALHRHSNALVDVLPPEADSSISLLSQSEKPDVTYNHASSHLRAVMLLFLLLLQMDGFDQTVNVKVIMATNRADTLDPALLRPGRLDRKIEFPLPDRRQKRLVFQVSCADNFHIKMVKYHMIYPMDNQVVYFSPL
ncbi:hypothetical protein BHE74_00014070 [Ensete ventricosum]|uniref:Proteasomal ATPase OB C-terminal domain-containing protein n=1 Tax=Ensete ventricosum TaxID=4639 RepID=A0A445MBW6_ENSVE|nr:hypothetical protein BHE74_00014070 [Ensete ventricosum]RZR71760.1 hypothetical protein BHM03_00007137 [Ensete ventricosum]